MADTKFPLSLVIRAVDGVTKPLEAINARLEKTGAALSAPFSKLGSSLGALSKAAGLPAIADSFGRARDAAGTLGEKARGLGGLLAGLVTGATLGGFGFYGLARSAEAAGSRLLNLSTISGLSVQAFAELQYAAQQNGVANDEFAGGMEKFNKSLSEARRNTGPLAALLSKVGPEYLRQLKGVKSNEEAFGLLSKAMAKIENPGRRAELAAAAFGKSGAGMINALKDGPAGVDALREEFRRLAGDQTEFANNSNAFGAALTRVEVSMEGLRNTAMGALMPALTKLSDAATNLIVQNRDGIQQWAERTGTAIQKWIDDGGVDRLVKGLGDLKDTVVKVVDKVGGMENVLGLVAVAMAGPTLIAAGELSLALIDLTANVVKFGMKMGGLQLATWAADWVKYLWMMRGSIVAGLVPSLGAAASSMWAFTASLLANPITWVVGLLAGAAYLIYKNWGPISGFFRDLWAQTKWAFSEAWSWIVEKTSLVFTKAVGIVVALWSPIRDFFTTLWDGVKIVIGPAVDWIWDKLKSWTILGPIVDNWDTLKTYFTELWDSITATFQNAWSKIGPITDALIGTAKLLFAPAVFSDTPGLGAANLGIFGGDAPRNLRTGEALGAAGALPPSRASETRVQVDFANVPRGVRVTPTQQAPEFELNLGLAMAPGT